MLKIQLRVWKDDSVGYEHALLLQSTRVPFERPHRMARNLLELQAQGMQHFLASKDTLTHVNIQTYT